MSTISNRTVPSNNFVRPPLSPPSSPTVSVSTADAPQPTGSPSLEQVSTQVQDTLNLGGLSESVQGQVGQLNQALQSLQQLTQSGPNASSQEVLQRFQQETLPQNIAQLQQSQSDLQSQLEALPLDSPERAPLQAQLQSVGLSLELYQQAAGLLANSPLLNPSGTTAAISTGNVEAVAEAPAPFNIAASLQAAVIPVEANKDAYRPSVYDVYIGSERGQGPNSPRTIFNRQAQEIDQQITQIDAAIQTQTQAGAAPEDIAKLQNVKTLLTNLADIYRSIPSYNSGANDQRGLEADVGQFAEQLSAATNALSAVAEDLDPETLSAIQGQLGDLNMAASFVLTMPDRPGGLGLFLNTTYKRRGEIIAEKRDRETPDIAGALQSYKNDNSDMAVFVQRFSSLRDDIRSGRLSGAAARDRALASIPGTSAGFRTAFTQLIDAEVKLVEAKQRQEAAARAIASAEANADRAEDSAASAGQANRAGQAANAQGQAQLQSGNFQGARAQQASAQSSQRQGLASIEEGERFVAAGQADLRRADQELSAARALTGAALGNANSVGSGEYGEALQDGVSGVKTEAGQVSSRTSELSAQSSAVSAQLSQISSNLGALRTENTALAASNTQLGENIETAEAAAREAELQRQREAQNEQQLGEFDELISSGQSFGIEITAKLKSGAEAGPFGATVSGSLIFKLEGEVNSDGSVSVDLSLSGEVSAEVKAFLELEAKVGVKGTYGLRFDSPEKARQFARLLTNIATSLDRHGIVSSEARAARSDFFRFVAATDRTSVSVYGEGSASQGDTALGLKIERALVTESNFDDSDADGALDAGERITHTQTLEDSLEGKLKLDGQEYAYTITEVRNPRTRELIGVNYEIVANAEIKGRLLGQLAQVADRAGFSAEGLQAAGLGRSLNQAQVPVASPSGRLSAASVDLSSRTQVKLKVETEVGGETTASLAVEQRSQIQVGIPPSPSVGTSLEFDIKAYQASTQTINLIG